MDPNTKRIIKGIAKSTGKYTLKGIGKGAELTGRGTIKTINALIKNPEFQKIVTSTGIIAASVTVPAVGASVATALALKYATDKTMYGRNKGLVDEFNDIVRVGNRVTRKVSKKILSPTLRKIDKGISKLGKNYQDKVDDIFR